MRKYAVALVFLLVASGCGGSSDTATPATTVAPAATQAPTTTASVVPTTTVAATTTVAPTTTAAPTTTTATPTTVAPTTTVEIPEELFVVSRWVSDACDPAAATRLRKVHTPNIASDNVFGALIDPAPEGPDFWVPPDPIPGEPGDVIWAREYGQVEGGTVYLILHHAESLCGDSRAVSGWIAVPDSEAPPEGRPIVSWGHGTRASADKCSPTFSDENLQSELTPLLLGLVQNGFVVVASDYEGSGTPGRYAYVAASLGKNLLDAARAARRFVPSEAGDTVIVGGISAGGFAMALANELVDDYAPELNLVGAFGVQAGVVRNASHAATIIESPFRGIMAFVFASWEAVYGPEIAPASRFMTDLGVAQLSVLDEVCGAELIDHFLQFEAAEIFRLPYDPTFANGANSDGLLHVAGHQPANAPVLLLHWHGDPAIPTSDVVAYIEHACTLGDSIQVNWHTGSHPHEGPYKNMVLATTVVQEEIYPWIAARIAGQSPVSHCGEIPEPPDGPVGPWWGPSASANGQNSDGGTPTSDSGSVAPNPTDVGCGGFESQAEAQEFFDSNPESGPRLDGNNDGVACSRKDDCCAWGTSDTGCGGFTSQVEAQTWFDAHPDLGETVDGNGDGTACGDGDFGGATDCGGRAPELVLPQFCDQYQT